MKYECGEGGQKLVSRAKVWSALSTPSPDFEYSPTRFSKKLIFLWRLIISIQSNRLSFLECLCQPKAIRSRSAQSSAHRGRIHPNEFDREGINNEFHFNVDCTADDVHDKCSKKMVE